MLSCLLLSTWNERIDRALFRHIIIADLALDKPTVLNKLAERAMGNRERSGSRLTPENSC